MSTWLSRLKLQSPFWQGVGAIVSIIALLISTFIAYDIYQKSLRLPNLTIVREYSFNPIGFGESSSKPITMSIDGEVVSDLEVYYYTLENTGNAPIEPTDYVEPVTVSVKEPLRILTVEKDRSRPEGITVSWRKVGENKFQLKPLLLNSGDKLSILVFVSGLPEKLEDSSQIDQSEPVSGESDDQNNESTDNRNLLRKRELEPLWNARIINVSNLKVTTYEEVYESESKSLGIFYTRFHHSGWSVYRFGFITCVLFLLGLFLGVNFGTFQKISPFYYANLSLLMLLSVVTGDNISSR